MPRGEKTHHLKAYHWKPGQSGNPAGGPHVSQVQFKSLAKAIADHEAKTGQSLWGHVVRRAFENDSVLKHVVDKLLPRRHTVAPALPDQAPLKAELERLKEMRARFYREVGGGDVEEPPLTQAPAPADDEVPVLEAEVVASEDQGPEGMDAPKEDIVAKPGKNGRV